MVFPNKNLAAGDHKLQHLGMEFQRDFPLNAVRSTQLT
jgi:hypothetical protein